MPFKNKNHHLKGIFFAFLYCRHIGFNNTALSSTAFPKQEHGTSLHAGKRSYFF